MMEAVGISETSVCLYETTRHSTPEGYLLSSYSQLWEPEIKLHLLLNEAASTSKLFIVMML
jgi:hypothetical protein